MPEFASQLYPAVSELHSVEYRNGSQLRQGPVLIVGAGNSGAEIARDLARTHAAWLSSRDPGHGLAMSDQLRLTDPSGA
jgi:putative flavoprotein involved in K+ transport